MIEALVLLFVFSIITLTFYQVISVGTRYIIFSKNRLGAIAIANEKMEIARNLAYEDVGIAGGVVSGNIPQEEDVLENGRNFHVRTIIQYEDDPHDGTLGGSPGDVAYKDYKTVKIIVSWNNGGADQGEVLVVSRFVPPGLETVSFGDGILSINVFSSQSDGAAVPQALVRVSNPDVGIDETVETNDSGNVRLVGAKESIQRYRLTVSKSGYETVSTFSPYPDTDYNPVDTHASVIGGEFNTANIDLNKTGSIHFQAVDHLGDPVQGLDYEISGGRKLGTEPIDPFGDIYNANIADTTDSNGEKNYPDLSPGEYSFKLSDSESAYQLISTNPISPFQLAPESELNLVVKVIDKNLTSLLARIIDAESSEPISGAEVKLTNPELSYDTTVTTGDDGVAVFPAEEAPLIAGNYEMFVSAEGFQDNNGEIEIIAGKANETAIAIMEN